MGLNDKLDSDVKECLDSLDTQMYSDRFNTIKLLLEKYIHKNKTTQLLYYNDLENIINNSKTMIAQTTLPKYLKIGSRVQSINQDRVVLLCTVESTIGYLNSLECFKRLPKFDYEDNKF